MPMTNFVMFGVTPCQVTIVSFGLLATTPLLRVALLLWLMVPGERSGSFHHPGVAELPRHTLGV